MAKTKKGGVRKHYVLKAETVQYIKEFKKILGVKHDNIAIDEVLAAVWNGIKDKQFILQYSIKLKSKDPSNPINEVTVP